MVLHRQQARRASPVITRHHNVHACTGLTDVGHFLIIHFAHRVCERSRSIDNTLGSDIELLPCERKQYQSQTSFVSCSLMLFVIHLSMNSTYCKVYPECLSTTAGMGSENQLRVHPAPDLRENVLRWNSSLSVRAEERQAGWKLLS